MNNIKENYKDALEILKKKPILLWGLSLLGNLLTILAEVFGYIPLIILPIVVTLEASLAVLYLKGLKGKEVDSKDLFTGFNNFKHVAGGMLWMYLWILIWGLIPVAGIVFAIIKAYTYRFTPYILMTRPEISATDALKESIKMTDGLKGKMFWADVLPMVAMFVVGFVLGLFANIPYIGILFGIILFAVTIVFGALYPVFSGLVIADFYDKKASEEAPVVIE